MTTVTAAQIRAAIKTVCAGISGVRTAYDVQPPALNPADMPLMIVQPGQATYDRDALGLPMVVMTRQWQLTLFVQSTASGRATQSEAETNAQALLDTVRQALLARTRVQVAGGTGDGTDFLPTGDSGLVLIPAAPGDTTGEQYTGCIFNVTTIHRELIGVVSP